MKYLIALMGGMEIHMEEKREQSGTSVFSNALIWFSCAVSVAELLTGTELEPLGMKMGLLAVLAGHAAGCLLLITAGLIGAYAGKNSMQSVGLSFGSGGSRIFAALNVFQLVGWQAVLIYTSARSANGIFQMGGWAWALIIGVLTCVWILLGRRTLRLFNAASALILFMLIAVLCRVIFAGGGAAAGPESGQVMSFGMGFELSIAMPLSWLPMISDYTYKAARPVKTAVVSSIVYCLAGSWMYITGLGAACMTHETSIDAVVLAAGLGTAGLMIIVLSCVTTNFIDAFSCGESTLALTGEGSDSDKIRKAAGIMDTVVGTALAVIFPIDNISGFLYLIGSVFAPMIAVQAADFFILRRRYKSVLYKGRFDIAAFAVWAAGFVIYRLLMRVDTPVGNTLPDMVITMLLTILVRKITSRR